MIPGQNASDRIPVTIRRAVEAIPPQLEEATGGRPRSTRGNTEGGAVVQTLGQQVVTVGAQPLRCVGVPPRTVPDPRPHGGRGGRVHDPAAGRRMEPLLPQRR